MGRRDDPWFQTLRNWANDPAHTVDLNTVKPEAIPLADEALKQLISLGQDLMPDAMGINKFAHKPFTDSKGGSSGNDDKSASGAETAHAAETTPATKAAAIDPKGANV